MRSDEEGGAGQGFTGRHGGPLVAPVQFQFRRGRQADGRQDAGKEVVHGDRVLAHRPGRGLARPPHDCRGPDAAFVDGVLPAVERGVGADPPGRPVIGEEDDQRILAQAELVQGREDAPDALVEAIDDGTVEAIALMLVEQILGCRQGRVRGVEGHLKEEGLAGVAFAQLLDGVVGEQGGRVAFFFDGFAVPPPVGLAALVEVLEVINFWAHEAVEVVEPVA